MADDIMLQEAVQAMRVGERSRARDLLTRLIKNNANRPDYWLYLSAVVDSTKERSYCLQEALRRDPTNAAARRGLVMLGGMPPAELRGSAPGLPRRNWEPIQAGTGRQPKKALDRKSMLFLGAWAVAGIFLVGLVIVLGSALLKPRQRNTVLVRPPAMNTLKPSATMLSVGTLVVRTPTPTFSGPTPLWMFLEETYTPTPVYVNTPHPLTEAYRSAMRAYQFGDWPKVILLMEQVVEADPTAADGYYHLGEAYRMMGQYPRAVEYFNQAIEVNASFAAPLLGRARARYAQNPEAEVSQDLEAALELDPALLEARLEMARLAVDREDGETALEILVGLEEDLPGSPLVLLYRAKAALLLDQPEDAVLAAQEAIQLDSTLLESYLVLGQAFQAADRLPESLEPLEIYTRYEDNNALAWVMVGAAYHAGGLDQKAMQAFSNALELDSRFFEAYLYRGLIYLEEGLGNEALTDLNTAALLERQSFAANLGKGRAYYALGYFGDAYMQIERATAMADGDRELAQLYYWKAQALDALERSTAAAVNWQALLDLSPQAVPAAWLTEAQTRLAPTPTPTRTARAATSTVDAPKTTTTPSATARVTKTPTP